LFILKIYCLSLTFIQKKGLLFKKQTSYPLLMYLEYQKPLIFKKEIRG